LDNRLADQIRRNVECRNGAAMPSAGKMLRAGSVMMSFVAASGREGPHRSVGGGIRPIP
jgi:hypothetical protein